jgi:hypothetical protein
MWSFIKKTVSILSIIFSLIFLWIIFDTNSWNIWNFMKDIWNTVVTSTFCIVMFVCWQVDKLNKKIDKLQKQIGE